MRIIQTPTITQPRRSRFEHNRKNCQFLDESDIAVGMGASYLERVLHRVRLEQGAERARVRAVRLRNTELLNELDQFGNVDFHAVCGPAE